MAVSERDPHTGHSTTGHEWNGIKELNTPVPKPVWFFLTATFLFSVIWWVLMPAWPIGVSYTKGLLGIDQREIVAQKVRTAAEDRASWTGRIAAGSYEAIQADPDLMNRVRTAGRSLFGDNCAVCHGSGATGGPGFPNLTAGAWLWGGTPEEIEKTIAHGINSTHPETRVSQMLAFGRDAMLKPDEISKVVTYVRSLSGSDRVETPEIEAGHGIFAANCASCHGEDGKGLKEVGAPDLTDQAWIYGGDRDAIYTTIFGGRQGTMPHWEGRLSPVDRKLLTLYVLDLQNREAK